MTKNIKIKVGELEDRFDPGFFIARNQVKDKLKNKEFETKLLGALGCFPVTTTPSKEDYVDEGAPVVKLKNIRSYFIDWSDTSYVTEEKLDDFFSPQRKDILITATGKGTVGRADIFLKDKECIVTGEIIVLRVKNEDINPYFLISYLRSEYGKQQLTRFVRGATGQTHLYSKDIKKMLVPIPSRNFQRKIEGMLKNAYRKKEQANKLLERAENNLLKNLGIDFEFKEKQIYKTFFSHLSKKVRLDAEYYQPKYKKLLRKIKESKFRVKSLSKAKDFLEISNEKVNPTKTPTKSFKYITIKNINPAYGEITEHENIVGHEAPSRARRSIKKNDVLVPYLSGSSDTVAIVPGEYEGEVATTGFYILRPQKAIPEFLFLLMRSKLVQLQIKQKTSGAVMTSINKSDFKEIKIPILSREIQEKVAKRVEKSFKMREQSRNLIQKANQKVKELVEG